MTAQHTLIHSLRRAARAMVAVGVLSALGTFLAPQAAVAQSQDGIAAIKQRGKLLAGVKFDTPPFGFLNDENKPVGFDLDMVRLVAKRIGVPVEFVKVTSPTRIPVLAAGNVDLVAASMTNTPDRAKVIDFSITYFVGHQSLLVPANSPIKGPEDLNGKRVAVQQGTTLEQTIAQLAPQAKVTSFKDYDSAWLALQQGRADAFTGSEIILHGFLKNNPKFKIVGKPFSAEPFGIGVRKGNTELANEINAALQDAWKSGEYQKLYEQWFGFAPTSPVGSNE
jgi:polar amino acid transport system substrate-binding protein